MNQNEKETKNQNELRIASWNINQFKGWNAKLLDAIEELSNEKNEKCMEYWKRYIADFDSKIFTRGNRDRILLYNKKRIYEQIDNFFDAEGGDILAIHELPRHDIKSFKKDMDEKYHVLRNTENTGKINSVVLLKKEIDKDKEWENDSKLLWMNADKQQEDEADKQQEDEADKQLEGKAYKNRIVVLKQKDEDKYIIFAHLKLVNVKDKNTREERKKQCAAIRYATNNANVIAIMGDFNPLKENKHSIEDMYDSSKSSYDDVPFGNTRRSESEQDYRAPLDRLLVKKGYNWSNNDNYGFKFISDHTMIAATINLNKQPKEPSQTKQ